MSTTQPAQLQNPYIGPRSFQGGEALYGRDRELRDLVGLLVAERIVLLHSPSGAGKTSLIQAALIPELRARDFTVLPVMRVSLEPPATSTQDETDTATAREALAHSLDLRGQTGRGNLPVFNRYAMSLLLSLEEALPPEQQTPLDQLAQRTLASYLDGMPRESSRDEVLIFDQFEEVLTVDPVDHAAKAAFFVQLGAALRDRRRWALFVMRDDYVAALEPYLKPVPTRLSTTFRLDLLGVAAAYQAIERPAAAAGLTFEHAVAAQLVDDLRRVQVQQPDGSTSEQLGPYVEPVQLQVVCYRLWEQASARHSDQHASLTMDDLAAVGDVNRALADYYDERVERAAAQSSVAERAVREWFERQLITPQGIRGQVLRSSGNSQGLDNHAIGPLIDAYLVRGEKRRGATWFELSHDRLIEPVRASNTAWFAANLSSLQRQADLWSRQGQPEGLLFTDAALDDAEQWAAANAATLTRAEQAFLDASADRRATLRREQRTNRFIRVLAVATTIASVVALLFFARANEASARAEANAAQAVSAQRQAETERNAALRAERVARARELAAAAVSNLNVDPERSTLLALAAADEAQAAGEPIEPAVQQALQQAVATSRVALRLDGHTGGVQSIAASGDGTLIATASSDGTVRLWDANSGALLQQFDCELPMAAVAFSPDSTIVAGVSAVDSDTGEGGVWLWDAASGRELWRVKQAVALTDLAFNNDGTLLISADEVGALVAHDAATGETRWSQQFDTVITAIAIDPSGLALVVADDVSTITLHDIDTGAEIGDVIPIDQEVTDLAFSPDGERLVVAVNAPFAFVYDLASGDLLFDLRGHTQSVYAASYSSDGRLIATASADGTARVWSAATRGNSIVTLAGHTQAVYSLAFAPDSATLLTASQDRTARAWRLAFVAPDAGNGLAFSADGTTLVTAGVSDTVIWDASTGMLRGHWASTDIGVSVAADPTGAYAALGHEEGTLELRDITTGALVWQAQHSGQVGRVQFDHNGGRVASAGDDGVVRLWDAASGTMLHELVAQADESSLFGLAFSPDGARLASAGYLGVLTVWDTASGMPVISTTSTLEYNALAYSPDGTLLASADEQGSVRLYDAATLTPLRELQHANAVNGLAFSPDGTQLASAGQDRVVIVWDVASGAELFRIDQPAPADDVVFSPDRTRLAVAAGGLFHLYPLDPAALIATARARVTRELTSDEQRLYGMIE